MSIQSVHDFKKEKLISYLYVLFDMNPKRRIRTQGSMDAQSTNYTGSYIAKNKIRSSFGGIWNKCQLDYPLQLVKLLNYLTLLIQLWWPSFINIWKIMVRQKVILITVWKPIWHLRNFLAHTSPSIMLKEEKRLSHFWIQR